MSIQDDPVKLAIEAKQTERTQLFNEIQAMEGELETKRTRLFWLDTFIEKGNLLLGIEVKPIEPDQQPSLLTESFFQGPESSLPIEKNQVEGAIEILKEFGRPVKAREIAEGFYKKNWKLSKDNGTQIIRQSVLNKHPELFRKLEDNYFTLK